MKKEYKITNNEPNVNFITLSALWWGFDNTIPYHSYKFNKLTRKKIKHTFLLWQNDSFWIWFREKDIIGTGKEILKKIGKDSMFYKKVYSPLKEQYKIAKNLFYKIYKKNLKKIDNKILVEQIKKLYLINVISTDYGAIPVMSDMVHMLSDKLEEIVVKKIDKTNPKRSVQEYIGILSAQNIISFSQNAKIKLQKFKGKRLIKEAKRILDENPWLNYEYQGPKMTIDELCYSAQRKELKNPKAIKDKQKLLKKELKLNKKEYNYFLHTQHFAFQKAFRMDLRAVADYTIDLILKEISRRTGYTLSQLRYCLPCDVEKILDGRRVNKNILDKRRKHCLTYFTKDGMKFIFDKKAIKDFIKRREKVEKINKSEKEFKGKTAYAGLARGIVKIISSGHDMSKMKDGDILVAYNTTPEFLPAMKKAGAIVTNMGGITCHAAIVSRELGIPCVVGVENANKVLKDGDLVEVDASGGIVKKLSK